MFDKRYKTLRNVQVMTEFEKNISILCSIYEIAVFCECIKLYKLTESNLFATCERTVNYGEYIFYLARFFISTRGIRTKIEKISYTSAFFEM